MKSVILVFSVSLIILFSIRIESLQNLNNDQLGLRSKPYSSSSIESYIETLDVVIFDDYFDGWIKLKSDNSYSYVIKEDLTTYEISIYPIKKKFKIKIDCKWIPSFIFENKIRILNFVIPKSSMQFFLIMIILITITKIQKKKADKENFKHLYEPDKISNKYRKFTDEIHNNKSNLSSNKSERELKQMGVEFEEFIVNKFNYDYVTLLEWQGDNRTQTGISPEANKKPDLKLIDNTYKIDFYVECKYRSKDDSFYEKDYKIQRYKKFSDDNKVSVFLAIGSEGTPSNPKNLYIIPISKINEVKDIQILKEEYRKKNIDKNLFYDNKNRVLK